MSKVVKLGSGEVDLSRPKRRRFDVIDKLRILAEVDTFTGPWQYPAVVRREGL